MLPGYDSSSSYSLTVMCIGLPWELFDLLQKFMIIYIYHITLKSCCSNIYFKAVLYICVSAKSEPFKNFPLYTVHSISWLATYGKSKIIKAKINYYVITIIIIIVCRISKHPWIHFTILGSLGTYPGYTNYIFFMEATLLDWLLEIWYRSDYNQGANTCPS